jgi:acyl carrier protein
MTWRPAVVLTVGVQFLPGFKNRPKIENIEAKVKEIICQQLAVSPEKIRPEASFVDDLKADSLAVVELVLALEEAFDMEIPDEDTEQIKTVGDAIDYIKKRK